MYHYIDKSETWTDAQQYCREKYTDLATVTNMTDMKSLLMSIKNGNKKGWLGLIYRTDVKRTWFWSLPGVKLNESDLNWNKGEPNDVDTENCGFLLKDLTLGDVSCRGDEEYKSYFVCFDGENTFY